MGDGDKTLTLGDMLPSDINVEEEGIEEVKLDYLRSLIYSIAEANNALSMVKLREQGLTLSQIGARLNLTQSWVSRKLISLSKKVKEVDREMGVMDKQAIGKAFYIFDSIPKGYIKGKAYEVIAQAINKPLGTTKGYWSKYKSGDYDIIRRVKLDLEPIIKQLNLIGKCDTKESRVHEMPELTESKKDVQEHKKDNGFSMEFYFANIDISKLSDILAASLQGNSGRCKITLKIESN